MVRSDYFDEDGVVSIWLGRTKPEPDDDVNVLRDLCGVESYDIDAQDVVAVGKYEEASVTDILRRLSYSSSFLAAAVRAADARGIRTAFWAVAQYDFAYDPARVFVPVAADPVFIGSFPWSDAEDAEPGPAPDRCGKMREQANAGLSWRTGHDRQGGVAPQALS